MVKFTKNKKTTLRQAALRLFLVAFVLFSPLGMHGQTLFSEDFEGGSMPTGWTTDGTGSWSVSTGDYSSSTGAGEGTYNAKITHGTTGAATKLITPEIDLSSVTSAVLSFMHIQRSWAGDIDELKVYYRASSSDSWTLLDGQDYSAAVATWTTEVDIVLPNISATYQIAFEYIDHYGYGLGIDNVVISQGASCVKPSGLAATLTMGNGSIATLNWTAGGTETDWVLEYGTASDFSGATSVNVNGTPTKDLTGLTAETQYYARVKADCGGGDESDWSTTCTFTPTNALTLTVYDGTTTNGYIPLGSGNQDYYNHSEYIIPASDLAILNGNIISSIKLYPNYNLTTGTTTVYLREVEATTFSSTTPYGVSGSTTVYTGPLTISSTDGMTVVFDQEFEYNGGNLLIGFYKEYVGSYTTGSFYGETVTGASIGGYGSSSPSISQRNFIPKTTFAYSSNAYPKPRNLAVSNITDATATVAWEAPNTEVTGYQYQYKPDGGTWSTLTSTTTTSANLSGLTSNTNYTFQVKAIYASGESEFATKTFTTACPAAYAIPYAYGFEDEIDMNCWDIYDVYGRSYVTNPSAFSTTVTTNTGNNFFIFTYQDYPDTDPEYMTLISPELTGIANGLHVEFYYRTDGEDSYPETFRVGYSTTTNDLSSFTWSNTVTDVVSSAYLLFRANYPAGTKFIAVQHMSDDMDFLLLDDFSFTEAPLCVEPSNLQVSNITTTGANLSWTIGGTATAWDVYVTNDNTVVPDDATTPTYAGVTSNTNYPISGLASATTYYVYVRSACDASTVSDWTMPTQFNSACEAIPLPYSYDFEDDALPICWNTIGTNSGWITSSISTTAPKNGSKHFVIQTSNYATGTQYVVLPEVDASYPVNEYEITFYSKLAGNSTTGRTLAVGVMTDPNDASTFVQVGEAITPATDYEQYRVRFNTYTGSGQYIAIKHVITSGTYSASYTYIDNIEVNHLPACLDPENIAVDATSVDAHGATISWTSDASAWQVAYRENGTTAWSTSIDVASTDVTISGSTVTYQLAGLDPETAYDIQVRANCGTDGYSVWTIAEGLFTTAIACPVPTAVNAGPVAGHTAYISWNPADNNSGEYNVEYRTAAYVNGLSEEFATTSAPTGWTRYNTLLTDDVLNGTTALTTYSGGWNFGTGNGVFDSHARMNLYNTNKYWLVTPDINVDNGFALNFDVALTAYNGTLAAPATTGTDDRFIVLVSNDNMATWTILREWNNSGSAYVLNNIPYTATGENVNIDLSSYAGSSVKIAFYGESTTSNADNNLHIDNVACGVPVAAGTTVSDVTDQNNITLSGLTPETLYEVRVQSNCGTTDGNSSWTNWLQFTTDVACPAPTTLTAGTPGPDRVDLTWTITDASQNAWQVEYRVNGTTDWSTPVDVASTDVTISGYNVTYQLTGLASETAYDVQVRANCTANSDGYSEWSNVENFTTAASCPAPVLAADGITNINGFSADVTWTGFSENNDYDVYYQTAAYFNGVNEEFGTSLPAGWTRYNTLLNDDVLNGTTDLTSATSGWSFGTVQQGVFNSHAKINIYGTTCKYWLVTPAINVEDGFALNFDLALTGYNYSATTPQTPATTGTDDRFVVLVSDDDMDTWTILREWNNSGSSYVYNNITCSATGENVNIDMSSYAGRSVKIAFYGESTTSNADNDLHIDNVACGVPVAAGTLQSVHATTTTAHLDGLTPETPYEVYVVGNCSGSVTSDPSETRTFTTTVACPAPTTLNANNFTTTSADLSWTGHGESEWTVSYKKVSETAFTDVTGVTENPYTLGGLEPATQYVFKVKANCSLSEESTWSDTYTFYTECDAITSFPWTENFESYASGNFSNPCWVNEHISGTGTSVFIVNTSTMGTNSTHQLRLPDMSQGTLTKLVLPAMTLPNDNYEFLIDVYRSNSTYSSGGNPNEEGIRVYVSTNGEIAGATELAFIPRQYTASNSVIPAETAIGWYTYTLPINMSGTCYIILRGESQYCAATYMDNFAVYEPQTFTMNVEAGKWYGIASPMHTVTGEEVNINSVANLTDGDYDLYRYNEGAGTWENYKYTGASLFKTFEFGRGYIYRRATNATLTFYGQTNTADISANGHTAGCSDENLKGFNLVGNPYNKEIKKGVHFGTTSEYTEGWYSLQPNGTWYAQNDANDPLYPGQAGLVQVTTSNSSVPFVFDPGSAKAQQSASIPFTVTDGEYKDVTYATFNSDREGLTKIGHLDANAPVLCIPVNGEKYAIAMLDDDCESFDMNFRANAGNYTISVNLNNMIETMGEISYLHLIDRATGRDIDLLRTNSYSFNHSGNENVENRFEVKMKPGTEVSNIFARWNGSAWVIEGNGTLQIFDVLGRSVMNSDVQNSTEIHNSQFPAAGVYILRLGDKSQKIVVK